MCCKLQIQHYLFLAIWIFMFPGICYIFYITYNIWNSVITWCSTVLRKRYSCDINKCKILKTDWSHRIFNTFYTKISQISLFPHHLTNRSIHMNSYLSTKLLHFNILDAISHMLRRCRLKKKLSPIRVVRGNCILVHVNCGVQCTIFQSIWKLEGKKQALTN